MDVEVRYPLEWPAAVPRTDPEDRTQGRFGYRPPATSGGRYKEFRRITWAKARDRLVEEVARMDGDQVLITSGIPVYSDGSGTPLKGESRDEDPGAAVYFTLEGDRQVMAIDAYDRAEDNVAAIAAVLEYMRGIERHGGPTVMAAAMSGFRALPELGSGRTWWDVLGVRPDDPPEAIKRAWKLRSRINHPDRGGDTVAFSELQDAWRQAKDARPELQ